MTAKKKKGAAAKPPTPARLKLARKLAANMANFTYTANSAPHPGLAPLLGDVRPFAPLPPSLDWSKRGVVSAVKDQGPYNTCTSFALTTAIETRHRIAFQHDLALSPGFIHTCLGPQNLNMPFEASDAVDLIHQYGIGYWTPGDYPFPRDRCTAGARYQVGASPMLRGPNDAKLALLQRGPVTATLLMAPDFLHHDGTTPYRLPPNPPGTRKHYVCVVGFDDGRNCWIIMNSMGKGWGWNGTGIGLVAYGACGMLLPPGMPPPVPDTFPAYETMLAPPHIAPPNAAVA